MVIPHILGLGEAGVF